MVFIIKKHKCYQGFAFIARKSYYHSWNQRSPHIVALDGTLAKTKKKRKTFIKKKEYCKFQILFFIFAGLDHLHGLCLLTIIGFVLTITELIA